MQHEPIYLLEQLELVIPVVKHRRLLKSTRENNWLFHLYFGPSFTSLYSNEKVQSLEYTISGYTDDLMGGPEPSMPEDHSGVLIKFNNKAFASWTNQDKNSVLESTKLSFNNQLSLNALEGEE
jgi:hypothetical protein